MSFEESLAPTLSVRCAGEALPVPGGNVKRIELDLWAHGFSGAVTFWARADAAGERLHGALTGTAPLEVELAVAKAHPVDGTPEPVRVRGGVSARRFGELVADGVSGGPVLFRRYRLEFVDAARAAWSAHHPTRVHGGESVEAVVRAQLAGELQLEIAWPELKRKRGLVCLALGEDEASFHDFVVWLADRLAGHLWLDYAKQVFHLADRKAALGEPAPLVRATVERLEVVPAEPVRQQVRVLDSWAGAEPVTSMDLPDAAPPLAHDILVHTPVPREIKERGDREARRRARGRDVVEVAFRSYPDFAVAPGASVALDEGSFSASLAAYGRRLRVIHARLVARAIDGSAEADLDERSTTFRLDLGVTLEQEDDPRARLPAYRTPRYPLRVEGRVLSAVGDPGDRAYTVYEDARTSQDRYRVRLPTWNATVEVPFTPLFQPGHLYFPAYLDARVLVDLEFDRAALAGFLDWGPGVRLPLASQGNHVLFGRNATSETSLRHWYVDGKPELRLRRAHAGDVGVIAVTQGAIVIETFEDDAAAGGPPTVSVRPEAQGAQARTEATAEVAVGDLESAVGASAARLDALTGATAAAVKADAAAARADVKRQVADARTALRTEAEGADAWPARARDAVSGARQRLAAVFQARRGSDDGDLAGLGRELRDVGAELRASAVGLEARVRGAEGRARAAGARAELEALGRLATTLRSGADELAGKLGSADADLAAVEERLASAQRDLERGLATLEADVLGNLDAARVPLTRALESAARVLDGVEQEVGNLVEAVTRPLGALGAEAATLRDRGDALVASVQSALASGVAAISAIPVDGLPPLLADGARSAVASAADAAGTALATAAQGAQEQLGPLAARLGEAISAARTRLAAALADGAKALVAPLGAAREAVQAAARTASEQADAALAALQEQLTRQVNSAEEAVRGTSTPAVDRARRAVDEARAEVGALVERTGAQLAGIERRLG